MHQHPRLCDIERDFGYKTVGAAMGMFGAAALSLFSKDHVLAYVGRLGFPIGGPMGGSGGGFR
eukprot:13699297-Alexandrium_andersonii.AAC.1